MKPARMRAQPVIISGSDNVMPVIEPLTAQWIIARAPGFVGRLPELQP